MFGFMGGRPPLAPRFSIPFLRPLPPVALPPPPPPPPPPVARGGPSDPFLHELVVAVAQRTGLPPRFVAAIVDVESGWDPSARSGTSDFGLFQLNAQHFGKRYFPRDAAAALDPVASAAGAVVLLSQAANRWGRRDLAQLARVAAEYNGGLRAARALADRPDVQSYVVKVLRAYRARGGR